MITIVQDEADGSVALFIDAEGGAVLVELIQSLIEQNVDDHHHLTDYVASTGKHWPENKKRSLTMQAPGGQSGRSIGSLLTIKYSPKP